MDGWQIEIRQAGDLVVATVLNDLVTRHRTEAIGGLKGLSVTVTHFKGESQRSQKDGRVSIDASQIDWGKDNFWKRLRREGGLNVPTECGLWGREDLPFYMVQIAQTTYAGGMLGVWEAQQQVMRAPCRTPASPPATTSTKARSTPSIPGPPAAGRPLGRESNFLAIGI